MMRNRMRLSLLLALTVTMAACGTADRQEPGEVTNSETIFFDYSIIGDEDRPDVVCKFQYRVGGPEGESLRLDGAAGVKLDGVPIPPDSARQGGVYYEISRPKDSFAGRHVVAFVGPDKKEYREEFVFQPFSLAEELPEQLPRTPFTIRLLNFPPEPTELRLSLTDTSRFGSGVNEDLLVRNGEVPVTAEMLRVLSAGPIILYLERHERREPRKGTKEGGQILQQYALSRSFELLR